MPSGIIDKLLSMVQGSPDTARQKFGQAEARFSRRPVSFARDIGADSFGRFKRLLPDNTVAHFFMDPITIATRHPTKGNQLSDTEINRSIFHEDAHALLAEPGMLEFLMDQRPGVFQLKNIQGQRTDVIPQRREDQDHQLIDTLLNDPLFVDNTSEDEARLSNLLGLKSDDPKQAEILRKLQSIKDRRPPR